MKLSFDDKESFVEAARSLHFNPPSDLNTRQRVESSSSTVPGENEDIRFNNDPPCTNPNTLRLMGSTSSSTIVCRPKPERRLGSYDT